jgi:hypothetical protein
MLQFAEWEPNNAFFKAHPRIPRRNPGHLPYRACRDIGRRVKFPLEPDTLPDYEVSFSHESPQLAIKNQPPLLEDPCDKECDLELLGICKGDSQPGQPVARRDRAFFN